MPENEEIAELEEFAEFMGLMKNPPNKEYNLPQWYEPVKDKRKLGKFIGYPHQLQYKDNWNVLIKVVEKIEQPEVVDDHVVRSTANVTIYYKACRIVYEPDEESGDENEEFECQTKGITKRDAVYKACLEFIRYYKKQKV